MSGLPDFNAFVSADAHFSGAWNEINTQLQAEGANVSQIEGAKLALTDSFEKLSTQGFGLSGSDPIDAAKNYVLAGQTIAGAVDTVSNLVQAVTSGPPAQVMQAFTGTLIGAAMAAGALSAGVGAAIVGAVGALLDVLSTAGLFGSPQQTCDFRVGDLCARSPYPQVSPGSSQWRTFPTASDRGWFATVPNSMVCLQGPWKGVVFSNCHSGERPIDTAFPAYRDVAGDASGGFFFFSAPSKSDPTFLGSDFLKAFAAAWKTNAEYTLNGLRAQSDPTVLVHTLRLWNRSHEGPAVILAPGGGTYAHSLVPGALAQLTSTDSALLLGNGLAVQSGPLKSPPTRSVTLHLHSLGIRPSGGIKSIGGSVAPSAAGGGSALGMVAVAGGAVLLFKPQWLRKLGIRL
jgi:hypothetical protein